ncbi:MAG: zf-HC2 domain-containing protein [Terriglobales bacterium]
MSQTEPHDEFLELCAVSTSGQLTEEEQKRLREHLAVCQSCREALQQYEAVVDRAIPTIAPNEASETGEPGPAWSGEAAEKAFFQRLAKEEKHKTHSFRIRSVSDFPTNPHRRPLFSSGAAWRQVWMLYAAGILLFLTLGFYAYRVGVHHPAEVAQRTPPQPSVQNAVSLEEQLSDAGHDREIAHAQIELRDKTIADLRHRLTEQSAEINQMKATQTQLESDLHAGAASRQDLAQQRTDLAQKLDAAQNSSYALQEKLDSLALQSAQDTAHTKALEAKANDLTQLLHDREGALDQKNELLAHDRDIRDLMGARDLYIAEVYDVGRAGETKKPYGRVFYTRGKSLIFYAYDLDQQSEAKKANSFQVWGRRGPDQQQALNLGIFYQDNVSKKRWILKCDDPKTLAQIDGVFVTVEPSGGSHKPSGKSLLFAYLKVDPNHP